MDWQKRYRWRRTRGNETGLNGKPHEDYVGYDGEVNIGRIYLDQQTLKAGKWRWAIQYPKDGKAYQPNNGWETTAAEAAKVVEDLWDVQKARLGKPTRKRPPPPVKAEEAIRNTLSRQRSL